MPGAGYLEAEAERFGVPPPDGGATVRHKLELERAASAAAARAAERHMRKTP